MKKTLLSFFTLTLMILTAFSCASTSSTTQAAAERTEKLWLDDSVPSLYETYAQYLDYFGLVAAYESSSPKGLLKNETQLGLVKHVNSISMENEFKPQFIFQWWGKKPSVTGTYTASNGITIKTPSLRFNNVDGTLSILKKTGLKARGHVLVWHSQTDDAFFYEDYDTSKKLVDAATMTAREEWYIQTVLNHVQEWEEKNNKGQHVIWCWDVVNEAVEENAMTLRAGSKWYEVYKNYDFIVNAFKFANKYAPADVLLGYNDYGVTNGAKRKGMLKVLDNVIAATNDADMPARIDFMGMQSHISCDTNLFEYQNAIQDFAAKGLDVQVTELDMAINRATSDEAIAKSYQALFKIILDNRKTEQKPGITAVTLWGINSESSWLNTADQKRWHNNVDQKPLLFKLLANSIVTNPSFDAVITAAQNYQQ